MKAFLKTPLYVRQNSTDARSSAIYSVEGFPDEHMFVVPSLRISIPLTNINYIDTSSASKPSNVEPPATVASADIIDVEVVSELPKKPLKKK